jgi:hypothetical protein
MVSRVDARCHYVRGIRGDSGLNPLLPCVPLATLYGSGAASSNPWVAFVRPTSCSPVVAARVAISSGATATRLGSADRAAGRSDPGLEVLRRRRDGADGPEAHTSSRPTCAPSNPRSGTAEATADRSVRSQKPMSMPRYRSAERHWCGPVPEGACCGGEIAELSFGLSRYGRA